jgi:hypothetical protein
MDDPELKLPVVKVYLDQASGTLWCKTPEKGARWHKGLKDMNAVAKLTAHVPRPLVIDYVTKEEL